jgi:hypothetical protein
VIGVVFAAVMAFGLAMVSREAHVARDLQRFLYGDILTIGDGELLVLAGLFVVVGAFQFLGYNRLLYIGLHPVVAQAHRVRVGVYQYVFAGLLALVVMLSIWAVGVLLVTALLIVPAAAGATWRGPPGRCSGGRCWRARRRPWPGCGFRRRTGPARPPGRRWCCARSRGSWPARPWRPRAGGLHASPPRSARPCLGR